jgi:sarcosine oxidase
MPPAYDVAVIGLGAMGSAAAYALSRRRQKVIGFDRYAPPHDRGSSHGKSRIIREAYFEAPFYVPLLRRAFDLWEEIERDAGGRTLFRRTGGLAIGPEKGQLVQGALASAMQHRIPYEVLSAGKLHRRFPAYAPLDEWVGVFEPRAGVLNPELAITTQLQLAARNGAELRTNEPALQWSVTADGVRVTTAQGTYHASFLVIAAGAWARDLLPDLDLPLKVTRQVLFWFEVARNPELFAPNRMPIALMEFKPDRFFYSFPDFGDGVKVAVHREGEPTTAESVQRDVTEPELANIYDLLRRFMPFAKGHLRDSAVCLYTNTPDTHFILDRHPVHSEVMIASPCSGHGFKFAPVVGEIAADLFREGKSRFDLTPFSIARFGEVVRGVGGEVSSDR